MNIKRRIFTSTEVILKSFEKCPVCKQGVRAEFSFDGSKFFLYCGFDFCLKRIVRDKTKAKEKAK